MHVMRGLILSLPLLVQAVNMEGSNWIPLGARLGVEYNNFVMDNIIFAPNNLL